jgi:molecular chaperone DnaK (HSP70)
MCVAIDFGTTFTTIAFTHGKRSNPTIYTVEEFPGDRCMGRNGTQVPSEIWYPSDKTTKTRLQVPTADANILYGYEIDRRLERADIDSPHASHTHSGRISKPKLLLDDNAHLRDLRKPLMNSLKQLKKNKLITKEEDVITDLLTCFLAHTKSILSRDYGYTSNTTGMSRYVFLRWQF